MRTGIGILLAVVVAGCMTGCEAGDDEGGFGVPRQPADAAPTGDRVDLRGTVQVESNGCLALDLDSGARRWIVWPADQDDEHGQPVLDGRLVGDGDRLAGTGTELAAGALPDWWDADGYFGSFGSFCSAEQSGIVVFDDVARG